jgi:hypothetical protein
MKPETKSLVDLPPETPEPKKPRDYKRPLIISSSCVLLAIIWYGYLVIQTNNGASGTEFVAWLPALLFVISIISAIIYGIAFLITKRKSSQQN